MNIKEKIFGEPGFSADLSLNSQELSFFQDAIQSQWLSRIAEIYPHFVEKYGQEKINNYHRYSAEINHEALWPKQHRLLSQNIVEDIKNFDFIAKLKSDFGPFSSSNVVFDTKVKDDEQEIYWRLVRPGVTSDIGPLHADKWFHNLVGGSDYGMFPPETTTVKMWIAIYTEPGLNGLLVVPNSHHKDWKYSTVEKNGQIKPQIEEDESLLNTLLVPTKPGTFLIFNERLLHGGAINQGSYTRVSAEITMVFD